LADFLEGGNEVKDLPALVGGPLRKKVVAHISQLDHFADLDEEVSNARFDQPAGRSDVEGIRMAAEQRKDEPVRGLSACGRPNRRVWSATAEMQEGGYSQPRLPSRCQR